ncbi:hypothetical protein [Stutzerimonas kunmingensis]|uniref:hypothetical protein n=1 Tax=Stutzerimonas kunmingensis TaxID=1211807 RepID=UPI0028A78305|nr:hypothetical protein [Stutzerimonas kunmingensis]
MKNQMRAIALVVLALVLAGCSAGADEGPWDGPFGTKQGISPEQLSKHAKLTEEKSADKNIRGLTSMQAPLQSASFQEYTYKFGDVAGLCSAAGLIAEGEGGGVLRDAADRFGAPKTSDETITWTAETHVLDGGIRSIQLLLSGDEPRVIIYEFIASEDCH